MVLRDDVLLLGRLTPPSPRRVASSPLRVWREGRRSPCIFCPVHRKSLGTAKGRSILPPQYPFFFEHLHFPFAAVMAAATAFASLRSLWSCVFTVGLSRCSFNRYSYGLRPRHHFTAALKTASFSIFISSSTTVLPTANAPRTASRRRGRK